MQLYIEKLYGDQLHYIRFAQIILVSEKEIYNSEFIFRPALYDKNKGKIIGDKLPNGGPANSGNEKNTTPKTIVPTIEPT